MAMTRNLYDGPLAAAVNLHVWQQLKTVLGLVSADVGSQFDLDAGDLSARLPATRTTCATVRGERDRPHSAWKGVYPLEIHYLRAMADGEDVEETTRAALKQIARLFVQEENWTLPTWTNQPGAVLRSVSLDGYEVMQDEELQQIEHGIGHGVVFVTAEIDSHLYTP